MAGIVSVERLSHFNCEACQRWWSIGDAPADRQTWFCPWCGRQQEVREENGEAEQKGKR